MDMHHVADNRKMMQCTMMLYCVRDSSGNPFLRYEEKIGADSPGRRQRPT